MEFALKTWLLALCCALLADVTTPLRISGAQLVGSEGKLAGVYRSTYKEPRPVRSASRNLARAEATMPESDARVSRSSHQTPLLVTRLLEEHAGHEEPVERTPSTHGEQRPQLEAQADHVDVGGVVDVSGAEYIRTLHPTEDGDGDGDARHQQPFSYQQFELDASKEEQLQEIDDGHGAKTAAHDGDGDAKYEFVYQVEGEHGEGDFGHAESRDGHKTWGRYYVHQPDGKVKTVRYWADHSGYHAHVDYHAAPGHEGVAAGRAHGGGVAAGRAHGGGVAAGRAHGGGVAAARVHEEPQE